MTQRTETPAPATTAVAVTYVHDELTFELIETVEGRFVRYGEVFADKTVVHVSRQPGYAVAVVRATLVEVDDAPLLLQPAIAAPHTDERDVRGTTAYVAARQDVLGAVAQRAQLGLGFTAEELLPAVEGALF